MQEIETYMNREDIEITYIYIQQQEKNNNSIAKWRILLQLSIAINTTQNLMSTRTQNQFHTPHPPPRCEETII